GGAGGILSAIGGALGAGRGAAGAAGGEQWYYISDASVRPVSKAEVAAAQAYILMYVRRPAPDAAPDAAPGGAAAAPALLGGGEAAA
ncbi:hypothetical protein MNEG_9403, partial [Monoraphidium neglectum]